MTGQELYILFIEYALFALPLGLLARILFRKNKK